MNRNLNLPSIPFVDDYLYKHYIIVQNQTVSGQYILFLLKDEPVSYVMSGTNSFEALQKYGKTISARRYLYTTGGSGWVLSNQNITSYGKQSVLEAMLYTNVQINLGGTDCIEPHPMPDDLLIPAIPATLPGIPNVDDYMYKHYLIVQDMTELKLFYLYLFKDPPVSYDLSREGSFSVLQKYGNTISAKRYKFTLGQSAWTQDHSGITAFSRTNLPTALQYSNFNLNLSNTEQFEANPMPDDQLVPGKPEVLPPIPNIDEYEYKHYFIIQDMTELNLFYLYLINNTPCSFSEKGDNLFEIILTYDRIGVSKLYKFRLGADAWVLNHNNVTAFNRTNLPKSLYYSNFDFLINGYQRIRSKRMPDDGLVPAKDVILPPIPKVGDYTYKHYFITQDMSNSQVYHLYLLKDEPVAFSASGEVNFTALQKYGNVISGRWYSFTSGKKQWVQQHSNVTTYNRSNLVSALKYSNFVIDFGGAEWFPAVRMPEDHLESAGKIEFPPVPFVDSIYYKHYYITQDMVDLNKFYMNLFKDAPTTFTANGETSFSALQKYGQTISGRRYVYSSGSLGWVLDHSNVTQFSRTSLEQALQFANIDITFSKEESYCGQRLPADGISRAESPVFPPADLANENGDYNYYLVRQDMTNLGQYYLYLFEKKPCGYELKDNSGFRFTDDEDKDILIRQYRYSAGGKLWTLISRAYVTFYTDNMNETVCHSNFDIKISGSFSNAGNLNSDHVDVEILSNPYPGSNLSGHPITGWWYRNKKSYYYDEAGMVTGRYAINTNTYFFDRNTGEMQTGWRKDGGSWYYYNLAGEMQTGWLNLDAGTYYLDQSGKMMTGRINLLPGPDQSGKLKNTRADMGKENRTICIFDDDGKFIRKTTDLFLEAVEHASLCTCDTVVKGNIRQKGGFNCYKAELPATGSFGFRSEKTDQNAPWLQYYLYDENGTELYQWDISEESYISVKATTTIIYICVEDMSEHQRVDFVPQTYRFKVSAPQYVSIYGTKYISEGKNPFDTTWFADRWGRDVADKGYNPMVYHNAADTHMFGIEPKTGLPPTKSEVFVFSGHGSGGALSFENSTNTGNDYVDGLDLENYHGKRSEPADFKNCRLAIYLACCSGGTIMDQENGSKSILYDGGMLLEKTVNLGARAAFGFVGIVLGGSMYLFMNYMLERLLKGDSIGVAAAYAEDKFLIELPKVKPAYYIYGDASTRLSMFDDM